MQPALELVLGEETKELSANTVSRLKQQWEQDYDTWRQRDLSKRCYVYIWADGIYSNVRMDDKRCLLVIIGSDDTGCKEVLAIADGALEFWKALARKWPETATQRCWVHKTANALNNVPKAV